MSKNDKKHLKFFIKSCIFNKSDPANCVKTRHVFTYFFALKYGLVEGEGNERRKQQIFRGRKNI